MNQNSYHFLILNSPFPQCQTGFVLILISVKPKPYTYIGTKQFLIQRLTQHNSGYGSKSTSSDSFRSLIIMEYICGFIGGHEEIIYHVESQWKFKRDGLVNNCCNNPIEWVIIGHKFIYNVTHGDDYDVGEMDLRSVYLFWYI